MRTALVVAALLAIGCGSSTDSGGTGGVAGMGGGNVPSELVVFVTASTHAANFGGFEGADSICAGEATDAGLVGDFKAWLSTLDTPAADRLSPSSVPYVLVDGTRIADDWSDLTDNQLQARIDLDATGQSRGGDVWTGTLPSGQSYVDGDCEAYTSDASNIRGLCGTTQFSDARWSAAQTPACSSPLRLFCFQQ